MGVNARRRAHYQSLLEGLVGAAAMEGLVITVSQVSNMPPAMGSYETKVEVRWDRATTQRMMTNKD